MCALTCLSPFNRDYCWTTVPVCIFWVNCGLFIVIISSSHTQLSWSDSTATVWCPRTTLSSLMIVGIYVLLYVGRWWIFLLFWINIGAVMSTEINEAVTLWGESVATLWGGLLAMMLVSCWMMRLCLITPSAPNFSFIPFIVSSAAIIVLSSLETVGIL